KERIGKDRLCHQLWREQYFLLVRLVVGNDRTPPDLAACSGSRRDGHKMRDITGHVYISTDQVVVFEKVVTVIYPQHDGAGNIQCRTATDPYDRVPVGGIVGIGAFVHIRLHGIFMDVAEYLYRQALP